MAIQPKECEGRNKCRALVTIDECMRLAYAESIGSCDSEYVRVCVIGSVYRTAAAHFEKSKIAYTGCTAMT